MMSFTLLSLLLTAARPVESGYQVGDYVTDFSLENVDGTTVSMADYPDAKGFMVVFTCNECPYAKLYQDRLIALHNDYAPKGYPVIAINPNDPVRSPADAMKNMRERAEQKNYPFPYLQDKTQQVTRAFGATNTPHLYILQKEQGKLRVAYIGTIDDNYKDASQVAKPYVRNALDALLSGEPITKTTTKAIGCTIKWADA